MNFTKEPLPPHWCSTYTLSQVTKGVWKVHTDKDKFEPRVKDGSHIVRRTNTSLSSSVYSPNHMMIFRSGQ